MIINFISKKPQPEVVELINGLFQYSTKALKLKTSKLEVNIQLVGKRQIKKLNKEFRKINKKTDVLSFPNLPLTTTDVDNLSELITAENYIYDISPNSKHIFLGDIVICLPVAKKQAKKYNNTYNREVGYLAVHGLLHLLGFDHYQEEDKNKMRIIEEKILSKYNLKRD